MTLPADTHVALRHLPPETWGRRFKRAREDEAKMSMSDAVELASQWVLTSEATISRLEKCATVPTGGHAKRRRQVAYVLCLAYGIDPADFGLTTEDVPPGLEIPLRTPSALGVPSTIWYAASHPQVTPARAGDSGKAA